MQHDSPKIPLVLACSGCSRNAQTAQNLAKVMATEGYAQVPNCISLINTEPSWVKEVRAGRPIMLIDGCNKCCLQTILAAYAIREDWHVNLYDYGFDHELAGLRCVSQLNVVMRIVQGILSAAHTS